MRSCPLLFAFAPLLVAGCVSKGDTILNPPAQTGGTAGVGGASGAGGVPTMGGSAGTVSAGNGGSGGVASGGGSAGAPAGGSGGTPSAGQAGMGGGSGGGAEGGSTGAAGDGGEGGSSGAPSAVSGATALTSSTSSKLGAQFEVSGGKVLVAWPGINDVRVQIFGSDPLKEAVAEKGLGGKKPVGAIGTTTQQAGGFAVAWADGTYVPGQTSGTVSLALVDEAGKSGSPLEGTGTLCADPTALHLTRGETSFLATMSCFTSQGSDKPAAVVFADGTPSTVAVKVGNVWKWGQAGAVFDGTSFHQVGTMTDVPSSGDAAAHLFDHPISVSGMPLGGMILDGVDSGAKDFYGTLNSSQAKLTWGQGGLSLHLYNDFGDSFPHGVLHVFAPAGKPLGAPSVIYAGQAEVLDVAIENDTFTVLLAAGNSLRLVHHKLLGADKNGCKLADAPKISGGRLLTVGGKKRAFFVANAGVFDQPYVADAEAVCP